jgi:hypothetical protein
MRNTKGKRVQYKELNENVKGGMQEENHSLCKGSKGTKPKG